MGLGWAVSEQVVFLLLVFFSVSPLMVSPLPLPTATPTPTYCYPYHAVNDHYGNATELPCGRFGVPLPSPHASLYLEKDDLRARPACTAFPIKF